MDWPMTGILYISCSPKGSASVCHSFAQVVVARLMQLHPGAGLVHRDLVASPPPFVDADFCAAIMHPTGTHAAFAASDALIEELDQADAVVIATPMHNYGVPAVLKAWVDQIVRIHRTFVGTPADTNKVKALCSAMKRLGVAYVAYRKRLESRPEELVDAAVALETDIAEATSSAAATA